MKSYHIRVRNSMIKGLKTWFASQKQPFHPCCYPRDSPPQTPQVECLVSRRKTKPDTQVECIGLAV